MSKKRTGEPWMPGALYGRGLTGVGMNVLVRDIERALAFQRDVLMTTVIYSDPDIAVMRHDGMEWMLHADHTYDAHPLYDSVTAATTRGVGVEFRLHHHDPDAVEARAIEHGFEVVQATADKGHGLRECFVRDSDGYVWVVDRPLDP